MKRSVASRDDSETGRRRINATDRLDSNLKLVNTRLKLLLLNNTNNEDEKTCEIHTKLDQIREVIYSDGKIVQQTTPNSTNSTRRRRPVSRVLKLYAIIFIIALAYYYYGHLKMYIIYALRLFLLAVSVLTNLVYTF